MDITKNSLVKEIVATDYQTVSVFESHNIDFCCGGDRSIEEVCKTNDLDVETLIKELNRVIEKKDTSTYDY